MNDLTSQEFESFVPVYDTVPEDWQEARPFLVEVLKKISNAVNLREIGWMLDEEILSGKAFIPVALPAGDATPQQFRQMLRKVIDMGPLPNNSNKTVDHGILVDFNFTLIQIYGAATDPNNLISIPLPFVELPNVNDSIKLYMDATRVVVTTTSNRGNFTRCFVTIEYIQEL